MKTPPDSAYWRNDRRTTLAIALGMLAGVALGAGVNYFVLVPSRAASIPLVSLVVIFGIVFSCAHVAKHIARRRFCVHSDFAIGHEKARCRFCKRVRPILPHENSAQPGKTAHE